MTKSKEEKPKVRKMSKYGDPGIEKKVWKKAKPIEGKDSKLYRLDPNGDIIHFNEYGKDVKHGWDVDHIKPPSRGGSDFLVNLQALNRKTNQSKGNNLVKASRHSKSNK